MAHRLALPNACRFAKTLVLASNPHIQPKIDVFCYNIFLSPYYSVKYSIRQATGLDVDQIVGLCVKLAEFEGKFMQKKSSNEEISNRVANEILNDKFCAYFIAEEGTKVVGVIKIAHMESGLGKVSEAFVLDQYRKNGIMEALFEESLKWALPRGIKSLYLTVVTGNDLAYNYWKKRGFECDSYVSDTLIKMFKDVGGMVAG